MIEAAAPTGWMPTATGRYPTGKCRLIWQICWAMVVDFSNYGAFLRKRFPFSQERPSEFQTAFLLPMRYKKHQTLGMIYIMVYTNIRL